MSPLTAIGLILLLGGLAGIFTIVLRKIPTLVKLSNGIKPALSTTIKEEVATRLKGLKYSSFLPAFLSGLEKGLRKLRVFILKMDNLFIGLIKGARERSEKWTIRSHAWMEHRLLRKKEKTQVLQELDKVEISEKLEKINDEVAKDEDAALKEKIEILSDGNGHNYFEQEENPEAVVSESEAVVTEEPVIDEQERIYIDLIAENPKDVMAYRALGFLYLNQKNYSDARACFRQALKLNPDDEEVKIKLEEIKGVRGKRISDSLSML